MGFFSNEDAAGYEHDQAPEFVIGWGEGKRAVDELVEHQACSGSCQSVADDPVIVLLKCKHQISKVKMTD